MPDQAAVESALVTAISGSLYPNGVGQPSIANMAVRVYRGWPSAQALNRDLKAGVCHVSVFPMAGQTRNTTDALQGWRRKQSTTAAPTLSWTTSGNTATLSGSVSTPQWLALITLGAAYSYQVPTGSTLDSIAAAMAALIPGATASGAMVTVPSATQIEGRAGVPTQVYRTTKRQRASFQISIWCPTPAARDTIAADVDVTLSTSRRMSLAGGYAALMLFEGETTFDSGENASLYRRDLIYSGEWPTTAEDTVMPALAITTTLTVGPPSS